MKTHILKRLRQMFSTDFVPQHVNRKYMRQWVHNVRRLGTQWRGHPCNRVKRVEQAA